MANNEQITINLRGRTHRFELASGTETAFLLALTALEDARVDNILQAFGFELKDAEGKQVFPRPLPGQEG